MTTQLPKTYAPGQVEAKWYRFWVEQGFFHADAAHPKTPFSIVLPPPNVTGSLHMGHALTLTIQDILVRWRRMEAYNVLWLPGTDHAGIATQIVVEREILRSENKSRHDLGREEFLRRVWQWKEKHGGRISEQSRALGASLDWERERFTMDPAYSRAVREAFVRLYEEGLIYRARRLINWCPRCYTALSDLEVEHQDEQGSLWYIAYPVAGDPSTRLVVATTRPETMLGDTGVAVHPDDERYRHLIGKKVALPLTDREIPIVGDPILVDREFGTGAVKVTPGHDFNDFEAGLRHNLEQISVLDLHARINENAPAKYRGMTTDEARQAVVADLEAAGLLVKVEPHTLAVGRCQRCDTVVEPMLSLQWFVKTGPLAAPAIEMIEAGKTRFVPESWTKTYMHWMRNIKDWCVSRQLWWGHRIPAWYCKDCGHITVARQDPSRCAKCGAGALTQDEDVLDTWFSSALWPFATLGWPGDTRDLKTFYPTTVMETGYDIIFFWVARMMMMGLFFMKKVPFRVVFLHAMVVDEKGEKMSKVKGNVIDPLDLCNRYGADAVRFTLAAMAAQGRNIKLAPARVEGYRNFANKIWNASRFTLMNLAGYECDRFVDAYREGPENLDLRLPDRWILSRLQHSIKAVDDALEDYKLNEAAQLIYRFIWTELCDWYVEMAKSALYAHGDDGESATRKRMTQGVLATTLETAMRLLHPIMPFLTEEVWQQLPRPAGSPASIMITAFARADQRYIDDDAERAMELLQRVIEAVRGIRADYNVSPGQPVDVTIQVEDDFQKTILSGYTAYVVELAKAQKVTVRRGGAAPAGLHASALAAGVEVLVPLAGVIDPAVELPRLEKEARKSALEVEAVQKRLSNPNFEVRAPAEVVTETRERLADAQARMAKLSAMIERLKHA
ncbi:MAG TPA: valine--tRNA ligase [Polyangia bacterium]|nr:valine--tRNA ligase [Polyangia bacterium]